MNPDPRPLDKQTKEAFRELSKLCGKVEKLCVPIQRLLIKVANLPPHCEILERIDSFELRLAIVNAALHQLEEKSFQRGGGAVERHARRAMSRMQTKRSGSYKQFAPEQPVEAAPTLAGKSPEFPVVAVLQFLVAQKKSGALRIKLPDEVLSFEVVNGDFVHTSTDHPRRGERLGEILIENGHVKMEHFMAFVDGFRSEGGTLLGMALVEQNVVTQEALTSALVEQMQRHFDRAFGAEECSFEFVDSLVSAPTGLHINVSEFLIETGRVRGRSPQSRPTPSKTSERWHGAPTGGWNSPETK